MEERLHKLGIRKAFLRTNKNFFFNPEGIKQKALKNIKKRNYIINSAQFFPNPSYFHTGKS